MRRFRPLTKNRIGSVASLVSSRRLRAPAAHHGPVLNQAVEYGSSSQSAIISGFQLSAIFGKPSPAKAAASSNPHRGQALTAFPRVRSSKAFRRRPLYRVDRPRRAGIRNPARKRPCDSPQIGKSIVEDEPMNELLNALLRMLTAIVCFTPADRPSVRLRPSPGQRLRLGTVPLVAPKLGRLD